MKNLYLSFNGFYGSNHSDNIDSMVEYYFEEGDDLEKYDINYSFIFNEYSKKWLNCFNEWLQDENFTKGNLKFLSLNSPKYYNYTTDKIEIKINNSDAAKIIKLLKKDSSFINYLTEKTISTDGYISFYSFHDAWDNKDDILVSFCLDYLSSIFEEKEFYNYYDRNNCYELLYKIDNFYIEAV